MSSTSRRKPEVSKHNFVLYFIRVGLGLSSFRKSKIKSEKTVDLSLKKYDFMVWAGLMWLRVGTEITPMNAWALMATVL